MKTKKKRAPRLPKIDWVEQPLTINGNQQWQSRDGMLLLVHSTQCSGIALPPLWILWKYTGGHWRKVTERRGRVAIETIARALAAEYEVDDDN